MAISLANFVNAAAEQGTCTIYIRMGFQIEKCGRSFFDSFAGGGRGAAGGTCRMRNAILACFECVQ